MMQIIDIGATEENTDWIKTPENRASEVALHDELARRYAIEATQKMVDTGPDQNEGCAVKAADL